MLGWLILGAVIVFVAVVIVRTLLFVPKKEVAVEIEQYTLNRDKIVQDMVDMIRCKTVSNRDESLVDRAEFAKFEELLQERFPLVHEKCSFTKVGKTGLLYKLKGHLLFHQNF